MRAARTWSRPYLKESCGDPAASDSSRTNVPVLAQSTVSISLLAEANSLAGSDFPNVPER